MDDLVARGHALGSHEYFCAREWGWWRRSSRFWRRGRRRRGRPWGGRRRWGCGSGRRGRGRSRLRRGRRWRLWWWGRCRSRLGRRRGGRRSLSRSFHHLEHRLALRAAQFHSLVADFGVVYFVPCLTFWACNDHLSALSLRASGLPTRPACFIPGANPPDLSENSNVVRRDLLEPDFLFRA